VSASLGLGLAAIGRPAYLNTGHGADLGAAAARPETLEAHAHAMLDAAWAGGIRYVDAARSYGRAESFLASWLARSERDVEVGSKWGYTYTGDWQTGPGVVHEVKDHSLAALRRQYAETRDLLGSHLDLYQIHSATLESGVLDDRGVLDELARIRQEDGISIGLSVSGPQQAATIRRALERDVFSSVQATWNVLEPSAGPALEEAAAAGWRTIVKEPLANGRLADRADAALGAALAQDWATTVLSGASTRDQLAGNLRAWREVAAGGADGVVVVAAAVAGVAAEEPEVYWARRAALPWT
jgi:aryl-alcohol dehydrogenase-like predicted oxidoreductase